MKNIYTHHRLDNFNPALDAAGELLAQRLLSRVDDINANTLQRLRAAREQAVEHRRLVLVHESQTSLSFAGHSMTGHAERSVSPSRWPQLSGIGMLLALLLGLWMIDVIQTEDSMQNAAEIDRVLLTDDLPPAAYIDPGFKYFLKLSYPTESR
ncbi:MAG: DUF3619 family protein [Rhodoferax sp.]|nr:DUF3619 family protein [Betaproteobacteria bacterium]NCN97665.1 DUF3619 family protein [Rhodoferax sp.]NCP81044.1 DUF3619 family protein [Rhodoferax sp.]NCS61508.1 DUF3619 family protein [Rhodoferax sp.]